ncbi:nucleoside transporter, putative [Monoraphidium neglectum]|uniref:Nucleoside transporter, putative n=1 Tax=Monoraphidium neglectum TaxID=145388 RepID=A0A0D2K3S2_9CHLO|nr:nucleoside transporter, putative [Monoraphidium neglectum]KIZ05098.1 nucleoside transporter, putative [Monoraphidium neglectum]|eukprot:XP_013904117.1 nucleoside transporter, putative [Monoraphidium neglectum]
MAADYWAAVYPGRHVDRTFTVCYLPTCLLLIGVFIRFPKLLSHRARILTGFGGFFTLMLAVPMIDIVFVTDASTDGPPGAYSLLLLTVLLVGVLDGVSQGAIFGDAAALPSEYTHAVVGGTASSGALISLLRIATKASLPATREGLRKSIALYFGLSAALSLACFGVYSAVLPRLGVVAHWRRRRTSAAAGGGSGHSTPRRGSLDGGSGGFARRVSSLSDGAQGGRGVGGAPPLSDEEPLIHENHEAGAHESATEHQQGHGKRSAAAPGWRECLMSVWRLALAIALIYVVTIAIFPGVLAEDSHNATLGDWYPLILMTLFNFSDLAGKNAPLPKLTQRGHRTLLGWSTARALFLPLFLLAMRLGAPAAVIGALTVTLGVSNGYLTALVMTSAHDAAPNVAAADMLENLMVFSLVLGLLLGALLGWCWVL